MHAKQPVSLATRTRDYALRLKFVCCRSALAPTRCHAYGGRALEQNWLAEQVFGPRTRSYLGWTLVSRTRPPGDGVDWPTHPREALHHV